MYLRTLKLVLNKKIKTCQKEHFNLLKEKEEINMVLWKEWLLLVGEKF